MRFVGSLIKYLIYLCIILIAIGTALFWFDTGSWLVLPVVQKAGNFFLAPMTLEINNINGSVRNGYSIEGVKLISGDKDLLTLDYFSVSPDWNLVLQGMNGLPFVSSLKLHGLSTDLEKVNALISHFPASSKDKDETDNEPLEFTVNPFNLDIRSVDFGSSYADLSLKALTLNEAGNFLLDTKIISGEKVFPFTTNAKINFDPLAVISSDLLIGKKGTGNLSGTLEPLKARLDLTALSLEELLRFSPVSLDSYNLSGRIDGRFFVSDDNGKINASGVLSMPRASALDIPFNFRLPFTWDGENLFALKNANFKTKAAALNLNASTDISNMAVIADGQAENISLTEIGTLFAPELGLKGEGGYVSFDIDTKIDDVEKMLTGSHVDINAKIPSIEIMKMKILDDLTANINLMPKIAPKIFLAGQLFGGKLFARGEAIHDDSGDLKPRAVVSVVNLDIPTLIKTFPAAKAVKKPSGKISATAKISDKLDVNGKIISERLSVNGITITDLLANFDYEQKKNYVKLENLALNLGKGLITASGDYSVKSQIFNVNAKAQNFDPKIIPELKDLMGSYNLSLNASGKASNINSIRANAILNADNVGYSGFTVGNVTLPVNYANNLVTIQNAKAELPGGAINLKGSVNLQNVSNPGIELALSTAGIKIADVLNKFKLQNKNMPLSGTVMGNVNIYGAAKTANVNANLRAENIKAGSLVNMPRASLDVTGNMNRITLKNLSAKINSADIKASGVFNPDMKNIMDSSFNLDASVRHLHLKKTLALFIDSVDKIPLHGGLNANVKATGTLARPAADVKFLAPVTYDVYNFENIALKLRSPGNNHYTLNTAFKLDNFRPEINSEVKKSGEYWAYKLETKPLDLETAIETFAPDMPNLVKGYAKLSAQGSTKPNSPIKFSAESRKINIMNKIDVENIILPGRYIPLSNTAELRDAAAIMNNGIINAEIEVDLNAKKWDGDIKVSHLDFGQLANKFLPEGELVGAVDAKLNAKGTFGLMPLSFANGSFVTTPGYLHKMAILERVTPTKKISFEKINGTFFWDGKDLFLNPGTGARAGKDEPLYRYMNVNGAMGIPGKGLDLRFEGRFDLKILDQLLGAMKGVFQYMTGQIATNALRDAAGRILGVKRRDFQSVSIRITNSWQDLRMPELKVTKPIEDFLPIDILNKDEEKQRDDTQFTLRLRFPTGKGDKSVEEDSTSDQFKQQLIDNLFNIGF